MASKIRILHLEDDPAMIEWVGTMLPGAGLDCEIIAVTGADDYRQQLIDNDFDLILSDYCLPDFDGLTALQLAKQRCPDIPFIFISGTLGEEQAINMLKQGAHDYILKTNMLRLLPSIEQALQQVEQAKQLEQIRQQRDDIINNIPGAVFQFVRRDKGVYELCWVSSGFKQLFGLESELVQEDVNLAFSCIVEPELQQILDSLEVSTMAMQDWHQEFRIVRPDQTTIWLRGDASPHKMPDGSVLLNGILTDISLEIVARQDLENRAEHSALRASSSDSRLQAVLNTVVDAIITIDENGLIQSCNPATSKIFGYAEQELLGKNVKMLMPDPYHSAHDGYISNYIHSGEAKILGIGREVLGQRKDGTIFPMDLAVAESVIDGQRLFTGIVRDTTERTAEQHRLRISEERFRVSQVYANIGTWDWDIQTGDLFWSDRIGPLFGYGDAVPETTYENFLNAVHPDDRQAVIDAVNAAVEKDIPYEIEHRVVWQDGQVRWVLEKGAVIRDEDGSPLHMLGVVTDIDQRKRLEQDIANQKQLLELTHRGLTHFIGTTNFAQTSTELLESLLDVTKSEYGFTGEILHDDNDQPYLKTHAITNIAWNDETLSFYEEHAPEGMEFTNLESLFGEVIKSGEVMISNQPANDPRACGLPKGHPALNAFLGVPVYYGTELVGMYGLANRPGGYEEQMVKFLEPFNATYGVIINARRAAKLEAQIQLDLLYAKEEAEEANRAKSEFLSSMSHELRTPLNAILGFAQLLEFDASPLSEQQKDGVDEIIKAGSHLLELINEVLDLARIESGRMDLSVEAVEFDDVYDECYSLIVPLAERRGIRIESHDALCQGARLFADKTRFKQILLNLLSNAVKYNQPKGLIKVNCALVNDGHYRISVTDTGQGISPQKQEQLFTAFERLGAEASDIEGTGIGLVITKRLVEMMNGRIGFESEVGKGTTFWIELPSAEATVQEQLALAQQHLEEQQSGKRSLHTGIQYRVLYIEDNPANLRLVAQIIERYKDIHMDAIHDPLLGLEIAKSHVPDLILLDINMPVLSGYEILERLRVDEVTQNIPVLAISANAMQKDIERGLAAGFDDYLTKPLNVPHFMQTIERFLKSKKSE